MLNITVSRGQSYVEAVQWYQKACDTGCSDENGEYDGMMDTPLYNMKGTMAAMYLAGGHGLAKDPSYAGEL